MKKKFFNMIEVLLALGVTAVGIMGILAVIPMTLNANRDAAADSYINDVVNTKFTEIAGAVRGNPGTYFGTGKTTGDGGSAPAVDNDALVKINGPDDVIEDGKGGIDIVTGTNGIYYFQLGNVGQVPDFSGHLRVWYEYPTDLENNANAEYDLIRFYVEASWPASKPYDERKKRIYIREYYNPSVMGSI